MEIWIFPVGNLKEKEVNELTEMCRQDRKERIRKIQNGKKKAQEAGSGFLLQLLQNKLGIPGNIEYTEYGKPYFPGREDVCFSITHTGNYVVLACGQTGIGADAEVVRKAPAAVAERFFTREESRELSGCDAAVLDRRFFEYWTAKEAYVKMTGKGLLCPLNSFEVKFSERKTEIQISEKPDIRGNGDCGRITGSGNVPYREEVPDAAPGEVQNTVPEAVLHEFLVCLYPGKPEAEQLLIMVCTEKKQGKSLQYRVRREKMANLSFPAELVIIE